MYIRSGKVQFLFWTAFFSFWIYLWILILGFQTFMLPEHPSLELPTQNILLLFVLHGLLGVAMVAGLFLATMIENRFYVRFFTLMMILSLATVVISKSIFG